MKRLLAILLLLSSLAWGGAAYRSSSSITYASHTNPALTAPAGIVNGDILLIVFDIGGTPPPTPTAPAGFSAITGSNATATDGSFVVNTYFWCKVASGESGNYTVTHSAANSEGYIVAISGADTTCANAFTPNPTINVGTGLTTTANTLTTTRDSTLVIFVSSDWGSSANSLTAPTGTTPTFTKRFGGSLMLVADGVLSPAGATGNKTITNNNASGNPFTGLLFSVQPPNSRTYSSQVSGKVTASGKACFR